jgi:hypothetical protein
MIEVTDGLLSYYCAVSGYLGKEGNEEIRLILCKDKIGDEEEVVKVILGKDFFEVYDYNGYVDIYPISRLVSLNYKGD